MIIIVRSYNLYLFHDNYTRLLWVTRNAIRCARVVPHSECAYWNMHDSQNDLHSVQSTPAGTSRINKGFVSSVRVRTFYNGNNIKISCMIARQTYKHSCAKRLRQTSTHLRYIYNTQISRSKFLSAYNSCKAF